MISSELVSTDRFTQNPRPPAKICAEQRPVVLPRHRLVHEVHPALRQEGAVLVGGLDHVHVVRVVGEVPLDQGQRPRPIEPKPMITIGPSMRPWFG